MVKKRLSLNSAYKLVWDAREAVRPNPGFWKQLRMLEKQVAESGAALDNSLKLGDDARDRRALHNIEALDSESRLVPAMGTAVTFSLKVADAREANIKLTNRHVPSTPFFLSRVLTRDQDRERSDWGRGAERGRLVPFFRR
jgi:hypothetical protein